MSSKCIRSKACAITYSLVLCNALDNKLCLSCQTKLIHKKTLVVGHLCCRKHNIFLKKLFPFSLDFIEDIPNISGSPVRDNVHSHLLLFRVEPLNLARVDLSGTDPNRFRVKSLSWLYLVDSFAQTRCV